ncbi:MULTISPECIES: hypothetical protein [Myroides]|uniref:DUF937 domain-containing protein n=1 Tax=Myroides albus TaxID=2562892 RepID=A0A6I3LGQ4_9FLAO|nr:MULTISPECIES: hypothetical protein [Myroides]MTG97668.1 hypothetical protein [Myroides albus]MVX35667.1 hypothetical protein [Myroides sp. LoEW2-1]UVD78786.1 hypothetical protein NWE55_11730 [Myroides albus]
MIDQITKLIEQVSSKEISQAGISTDLAGAVTKETGDSIINGFKDSISGGDLGALTSLLGGGTSNLMSNPMVMGMITNLVGSLTSKLGLGEGIAKNFAGSVIPGIIESLVSKSKGGESGFQITDLISSFGGGDSKGLLDSLTGGKEGLGGAMNALKGLF